MKRFNFRLQRVLEIRDRFRDERRQELGQRNFELDRERRILGDLDQEFLRSKVEEGGTYSASELLLVGEYSVRLKEDIEQQQLRVAAAEQAAEEARERYIEASKETQALEKLKERRREEYVEQALKEEGSQLDEFAVQRSGRRAQSKA
jgi:flagellar export protein FliJ